MATVRLQSLKLNPAIEANKKIDELSGNLTGRLPSRFRLPPRPLKKGLAFAVYSSGNTESEPSISQFTSSIGSPSTSLHLSQWNLTQRHINVLNVAACLTAVSATWLFCSAIPAMLAFRRAVESLEKLLDVTREELPGTMAAIRLSGMEISDLTMELSDLGQEITKGVRSSTQAVRVAEERLRGLTNMNSQVPMQVVTSPRTQQSEPALARNARGIREGIVKSRSMLQMFFTFTRLSKLVVSYLVRRAKQKAPQNM